MTISAMHMAVLRSVADCGEVSLREVGEAYRQRLIDLGMQEPPLVDVDGERVKITAAGARLLAS